MADEIVTPSPWQGLRRFTTARIGLGRAGDSLPTDALLAFQFDHARARDAVHLPFEAEALRAQLEAAGHEVLMLHSDAESRAVYLRRPDLGRRLSAASRLALEERATASAASYDIAFVIADGLSALATHSHAVPLLSSTAAALQAMGWRVAPVAVASQARVALADEIGQLLGAEQVAILIGERPGLSVADSLGVYLTCHLLPRKRDSLYLLFRPRGYRSGTIGRMTPAGCETTAHRKEDAPIQRYRSRALQLSLPQPACCSPW